MLKDLINKEVEKISKEKKKFPEKSNEENMNMIFKDEIEIKKEKFNE